MSEPIRTKPKSSMKIDNAPTPHNTPASVVNNSFLRNGNPVQLKGLSKDTADLPQTIGEEDIQSAFKNQPLLLQSIQEKLGSLVGQDSGYVEQLPPQIKDRIYGLKKLQNDLFSIEKDFQVEMFELEQKYLQKYTPLHDRRRRIVVGEEEPTEEEINKGKEIEKLEGTGEEEGTETEPEEEKQAAQGNADLKGIPSFWLTALENLPVISDTITDRDAEVLDYLQDVQLQYLSDGKPGFKLLFVFDKQNPFFDNTVLTKTYYYQTELGYSGDFIYDHAEGDKINWADNESNVTISVEKRKQRNKVTKQVRTIEKITPVESFFNFFDPPRAPSVDSKEDEQQAENEDGLEDEDELEELEQRLALDYSIGEQLKDKLVPRAIDWFTGAALEFEFDNEAEDEFEEGDDDEDDEDDDEEDEEDDDDDDDDDGEDEEEADDFAGKKEAPPDCKQS
ncbi:NAP1 (YKR048C) [Zygosaccharomyces parabailii]|nr:NAP1 (YKR048C) [Zygosaccharomyces parabailii]